MPYNKRTAKKKLNTTKQKMKRYKKIVIVIRGFFQKLDVLILPTNCI